MNLNSILFGAAYYDEYMPYDRLDTDMKMMKEAGMNVIRIAESTWSTLEPTDGNFDFTHLDRMLDASEEYGLSVIVGTPTYALPAWLAKKHPDILATTHAGHELYGRRQNMDIAHPQYQYHAERMIRALMAHIKDRPSIIGYQLDNETNHYDTCGAYSHRLFVDYLKETFFDLTALNRRFGLDYWSNRINTWEEFPDIRGTINGSLGAEYEKFQRGLVTNFLQWQADLIQEYKREDQFLTHNFDSEWRGTSYGFKPSVAQFDVARYLTIAGMDIYHLSQEDLTGAEITYAGAIARGLKNSNYLVLETQAQGYGRLLHYKGQLRLQGYNHLACGSNSVMYWHWHSIHNSFETYWKGVLSHDFAPNVTYQEASQMGAEFTAIGHKLVNLKKHCKIAFLLDNASLTGLEWFKISDTLKYNDVFRWLHDAFYKLNLECDVISIDCDHFDQYSLIITPALYSIAEANLILLDQYVKNGGHLFSTFKTAFSDEYLKVYHDTQPHLLSSCFGIWYDQFTIPKHTSLTVNGVLSEANEWMELLTPTTAQVWATYEHPHWNEYAAITHNQYGYGTATYLGTYFDETILLEVIKTLIPLTGLVLPEIVFPLVRKTGINGEGRNITYISNFSDAPQTFTCTEGDGMDLLTRTAVHTGDSLTINAWDLVILEAN